MPVFIIVKNDGELKVSGFNAPYCFLTQETADKFARNFLGKGNYRIDKYLLTRF